MHMKELSLQQLNEMATARNEYTGRYTTLAKEAQKELKIRAREPKESRARYYSRVRSSSSRGRA